MSGRLLRRWLAALLLATAMCPALADESLSYDPNGNILTRTLPGGTTTYGCDDLNRLNSEAGPARSQSFTYDPNDNRLSDGAGTKVYAPNSDRIVTENGQTFTLDAAGNVTSARGLSFTWNQAGRLKSVKQGTTLLASYFYDYKGRRSRKVVPFTATVSVTTNYVYDLHDRLIAELSRTGGPLRTYVWRDEVPLAIIVHAANGADSTLYLDTDHLGSPIAARDASGIVVWRWESDAFGTTPPNQDPDGDGIGTIINLRFPGQYFDKESGLHYNWHRYYDPHLGRYLSPDPVGLAGGRNLYGYVNGNPVSKIDPTGLAVGDWWDFPANLARARQIAREEIVKRPLAHNDLGDAMRHAEWMRRTTRETNSCTAWIAGTGHELDGLLSQPSQPLNEMFMDLHNNAVGREAGRTGTSVDAGKLWTLPLQSFPYNQYRGGAVR